MSDTFMSDSEETGGDFSASEDDWVPEKSDGKNKRKRKDASDSDDDSDLSDASSEDDELSHKPVAKGRHMAKPGRGSRKSIAKRPSKRMGNVSAAIGRGPKQLSSFQDTDSDSGDEHLVDPTKLDLNSKFFAATMSNMHTTGATQYEAPIFDCNAGMGKLSDSSEEDENDGPQNDNTTRSGSKGQKLISKINEASKAYVNFQDFTKTLETAKNHLESVTKKQQPTNTSGNSIDISSLLALGEKSTVTGTEKPAPSKGTSSKSRKTTRKQAESDSDWEEVEESAQPSSSRAEAVQITLKPEIAKQKKKKCTEIDVEACIKRMINREKRDAQLVLHKVTIIMGIAHGNYTNSVLNSPALLAIGKALIPSDRCYPKDRTNVQYFQQIMQYYRDIVDLKDRRMFVNNWKRLSLEKSLRLQLLSQMANCKRDYILMFIILLRSIGIQCRMVTSLQTVPKVLPNSDLLKVIPAKEKVKVSEDVKKKIESDHDYGEGKQKKKANASRKRKSSPVEIPQLDGADDTESKESKRSKRSSTAQAGKVNEPKEAMKPVSISPRKTRKQRMDETKNTEKNESAKPAAKTGKRLNKEEKSVKNPTELLPVAKNSKDGNGESSKMIRRDYVAKNNDKPPKQPRPTTPAKLAQSIEKSSGSSKSTSTTPSPTKQIVKIERFSQKTRKLLNNKVLSTDDEESSSKVNTCNKLNLWIEAYAEEENRWIPLDVTRGLTECANEIVQQASSPMLYVLAWNNDGSIKDVSARYCADYLTVTIKHRIMQQWMDNVLAPFDTQQSTPRDIAEDRELNRILEERPLPRTVAEYKNHPYFALKRHLLKFEAIYPADAPTLGFTSGKEPVYARECVHTLHAREVWLKQARTVKMFETPYKIVSGRPKYDRSSGQMLPSQPLELFGYWQTEEYDPPTAEGGVVPRNAYGNVELFKPCMLPKKTVHLQLPGLNRICKKLRIDCAQAVTGFDFHGGSSHPVYDGFVVCEEFRDVVKTVHLQLPGLNRICKKLRIDCAQAVTGFDFHGGSSHPVYDGFVVCEEFRDVVVDAWHEEQQTEEQRAREKYEKRVYGNWKKLIKGLLIRRKLQHNGEPARVILVRVGKVLGIEANRIVRQHNGGTLFDEYFTILRAHEGGIGSAPLGHNSNKWMNAHGFAKNLFQ
uniref:Rad4 beta-hairpin domain-containing protein n=1 Tax=Anopheles epiroticus TaxID=199890 RepID=A0A182P8P0_9DIPT